ncbi:MAG TPA: enoyl-CoA hydratase/isomerase family protein [Bacteroidales bacterium]|nr:enoyl-CoA hydratase/isomerase family protein [Bacteroidales bacterium]
MDKHDIVHWKREGDIGILSLSNGKENYLEVPDFIGIEKFREWTEESGLKGVIIHGVGRNFSAGANLEKLNELAENYKLFSERITRGKNLLNYIEHLEIPVIAAINGVCFGGGLEIALACSMRIGSKNALFAFPEINHGLIPGLGGAYRSVKLLKNKALEIILNGDMLNAEKALKIGLIDDITNDKDAFEYAHRKMLSMTEGRSPELIRFAMRALKNADLLSKEDALREETRMFCKLATNLKI